MAHELTSIWVLIHPPLSVLGYLITLIAVKSAVQLLRKGAKDRAVKERDLRLSLTIAWWVTMLGLVTGMIWAQAAWGSFWSWDPKETAALTVFLTLTAAYLMNLFRARVWLQLLALASNMACILGTISISFIDIGLHSFG